MSKLSVSVVSEDISKVKVDALITAINSGGMWFGGIDRVIRRVSGNLFHNQVVKVMPLKDGQTIVALGNNTHHGEFTNVVFVVDDLKLSLHEIIYNGLKSASDSGFKSVSLPTIRMGEMLGEVEKNINEAVEEIAKGVRKFVTENPSSTLKNITFVVYNDKNIQFLLQKVLM